MNTVCRIQHKGQVTIPTILRNRAGLSKGDMVEFSFLRGKIVITPKVVIDRAKSPNSPDEYTPEQRRIIDAGIRQGLEDFKHGRSHGPFATAKEAGDYIERAAKTREAAAKPIKRTRR